MKPYNGPYPLNAIQAREVADLLSALDETFPWEDPDDHGLKFGEGNHIAFQPIAVTTDALGTTPEVLGWIVMQDFGVRFTQEDPYPKAAPPRAVDL